MVKFQGGWLSFGILDPNSQGVLEVRLLSTCLSRSKAKIWKRSLPFFTGEIVLDVRVHSLLPAFLTVERGNLELSDNVQFALRLALSGRKAGPMRVRPAFLLCQLQSYCSSHKCCLRTVTFMFQGNTCWIRFSVRVWKRGSRCRGHS